MVDDEDALSPERSVTRSFAGGHHRDKYLISHTLSTCRGIRLIQKRKLKDCVRLLGYVSFTAWKSIGSPALRNSELHLQRFPLLLTFIPFEDLRPRKRGCPFGSIWVVRARV